MYCLQAYSVCVHMGVCVCVCVCVHAFVYVCILMFMQTIHACGVYQSHDTYIAQKTGQLDQHKYMQLPYIACVCNITHRLSLEVC